jgi:hypothetical protein
MMFDARQMLMGHRGGRQVVVNALNCASFHYRSEQDPHRQHQLWACGDCNDPERLWLVIMGGSAGPQPMMTDVLVADITAPATGLLAPPERVVVYDDAGAPYVLLRQQQ